MKEKGSLGKAALFLEFYFFMPLAFYFAFDKALRVAMGHEEAFAVCARVFAGSASVPQLKFFSFFLADFLLVFFNITVGLGLIFRKNLYRKPEGAAEVFVPLLSALFMNSFNLIYRTAGNVVLLPVPPLWVPWLSLAGSLLVFAGLAFGFWALLYLKNSFAVFVEVRDVVTAGPYRYVRHPMYFGYILQLLGLCMVYSSILALELAVVAAGLFWVRARLEERKIAAFSEDYRRYQQSTPFLVPFVH